ncbi:MAG: Uma2 family endonuclease [Dehalococcoidia bacterium]
MTSRSSLVLDPPPPSADIPPLESGDVLTPEEFERRWEFHPEIKKAELIDGQVYLEMTVSRRHGKPHGQISDWLGVFVAGQPHLERLTDTTVRLPDGTVAQPDVQVRRVEGGTSTVSDDDCVDGPPELAAEVAVSSASNDLHRKKEAYRRNGVAEYIVWQLYEGRLDWFALVDGQYVSLEPDATGVIESRVFPGLRLPVAALLAGEMEAVLAAVRA